MNRVFIPGGEWLYFKIYTGHKSADDILKNIIYPLCTYLKNTDNIDKYFFIRYNDPKFHIRLRLHIENPLNYGQIFIEFFNAFNPCIQNGLVWNIKCDTYKRELERYGDSNMSDAEDVFCIDSESILLLLQSISQSEDPETTRWQISLIMVDDILNAYGFELERKAEFMNTSSNSFKREFGFNTSAFTKQLNNKFRLYRQGINETFNRTNLSDYKEIIDARFYKLKGIASQKQVVSDDYVRSLIHMSMNRFFRSKNRIYELVIYEFLSKHYSSVLAKQKYFDK